MDVKNHQGKERIWMVVSVLGWLAVSGVLWWLQEYQYGKVFKMMAQFFLVYPCVFALFGMMQKNTEKQKPQNDAQVGFPHNGTETMGLIFLVVVCTAFLSYDYMANGDMGGILLIGEWIGFLIFGGIMLVYEKKTGKRMRGNRILTGLFPIVLLVVCAEIGLTGIKSVPSMQRQLESQGYEQVSYQGEQDYAMLITELEDAPKVTAREGSTGMYRYTGTRQGEAYVMFVSPATGRVIAEIPQEEL